MQLFVCVSCHSELPIEYARHDSYYKQGWRPLCRVCDRTRQAAKREKLQKPATKKCELLPLLTEADKTYLAGLFDGEGYAGVTNCNGYTRPTIRLGMSDKDPVYFFTLCFGGSISKSFDARGTKDGSQRKLMYRASVGKLCNMFRAASILKEYCLNKSKVEQVSRCLEWFSKEVVVERA